MKPSEILNEAEKVTNQPTGIAPIRANAERIFGKVGKNKKQNTT